MNTVEKNHSDFPNRTNFPSQQHGRRKYNRAVEIWKSSHSKKETCYECSNTATSTPILEYTNSGIEQVNSQTHFYYSFTFCSHFYPFKL